MNKKNNKFNKLILHIGVHKTGTTAIQSFLNKNNYKLNMHGFYMPVFLYNDQHKPMNLRFSIVNKEAEKTRYYLEEIVNRASQLSCNTVIISDENYCQTDKFDMENVKIFGEYFDEIIVLLYCRRHDKELESRYAFQVMWEEAKLSDSPEQWFRRYKGRDYFELAKFYEKQVKGCRTKAVSYDLNAKCLINSFIDACGIPQDEYVLPSKENSNITANKYIIEVMCGINQYFMSDLLFFKVREYIKNHPLLQNGPKALFYNDKERKHYQNLFYQSTQSLVDTYHSGKSIFDELKDIPIPKGLDKQIKKDVIKEIVKYFNLRYHKEPDAMIRLKNRLKIGSSILSVDIYREIAIFCEKLLIYGSAYRFMSYAKYLRPDGPVINKRLNTISKIAFTDIENKFPTYYDYQSIISFNETPLYDKKIVDNALKVFKKKLKTSFFLTKKIIYKELALFFNGYDEYLTGEYFQKIATMKIKKNIR